MGQGVFGIEAASKYYFGKSSKDLTKSEAAWIAVVLPSPKKYDPKKSYKSNAKKTCKSIETDELYDFRRLITIK
jgi:membrane peptidoglycan carboxypeptidase